MLISTRSRYGLRALAEMARRGRDVPVSLGDLARDEDVSTRYLEQIFGRLRAKGLVKGRRGPGGGYVLSRDPSQIRLFEIVCALENCLFTPSCLVDLPDMPARKKPDEECSRLQTCVTRKLWTALRDSCYRILSSNTLADLADGTLKGA